MGWLIALLAVIPRLGYGSTIIGLVNRHFLCKNYRVPFKSIAVMPFTVRVLVIRPGTLEVEYTRQHDPCGPDCGWLIHVIFF